MSSHEVDVLILGAGLAGLSTAHRIHSLSPLLNILILEARDRVGGRTWSRPLSSGEGTIDVGAAWINDTNQSRMFELVRRFGAELVEQNTKGDVVLQHQDGRLMRFAYGELPGFEPKEQAHVETIRDMVEADCQKVSRASPRDAALDALSFLDYLKSRNASDLAIATASIWTRAMLGQEPENVSALYFLNYCKSGGGLLQMRSDCKDGGQYLRVKQGTQIFSQGLANSLPKGAIKLNSPVTTVSQHKNGMVTVQTKDGSSFQAKKVVSAIPQTVLRTITFSPLLPEEKALLTDSFQYGYYAKVMLRFTHPFWVEKGFCGLAQSFKGPASVIRDTSVPADENWILTCFLAGQPGEGWSRNSETERTRALVSQVGELWQNAGEAETSFVEAIGHEWCREEYSGWGCPCPSLGPGVLTAAGHSLRAAVGNIHFAGTETADVWKGYMEGAVRSGDRAGEEVVAGLKGAG
ncbi:hypothetical protein FKW77_000367 [Venturia effusa]|uniref:Amine oxidase n=1 Tax=Venturia effusa TaxID=50376 RepID=A0A517LHW0_9PEZI|nr:hypothetical protein FKW77_000367 [Venturia effusa]